nr:copper homeostasis protein CutC [Entomoplasma sp. MP1]
MLVINESKADRIEFCTNLEDGGLTPSYKEIKKQVKFQNTCNVILRPTARDFIILKKNSINARRLYRIHSEQMYQV